MSKSNETIFSLSLALSALLACGEAPPGPETDPSAPQTSALSKTTCDSNMPAQPSTAEIPELRARFTVPTLLQDKVVVVPDGYAASISADGRRLTVDFGGVIGGPGPRPGTVWDCTCAASDSGCYWYTLDGLSWCKGSCGGESCRAKVIPWPGATDVTFETPL